MMAGLNGDHAAKGAASVSDDAAEFAMMGISPQEKKEWEVKFEEMLGFKQYFGEDEVFDLSIPITLDQEPIEKRFPPLSKSFVKAGEMHEVPPSIIRTFMPTSYKSKLIETQVSYGLKSDSKTSETSSETNDFVSCDNSPSTSNGPSVTERNADYAEELARLQRHEYEAKDVAERYGYLFSQETTDILSQAEAAIRKNGISTGSDSGGSMPDGSSSASGYPAGSVPAGSEKPAGSTDPAGSIPAASTSVSVDSIPVYAEATTLP
nr:ribonuclease H-like domain, reverse transcriptase, RNA-dependent DNA polymerase [Tanacetum cinerariifolium]